VGDLLVNKLSLILVNLLCIIGSHILVKFQFSCESRAPPWSSSSVLDHRSLRGRGHIWRLFHLWLRFITFGGRSAHLVYHVHKSGRKTAIKYYLTAILPDLIITRTTTITYPSHYMESHWQSAQRPSPLWRSYKMTSSYHAGFVQTGTRISKQFLRLWRELVTWF